MKNEKQKDQTMAKTTESKSISYSTFQHKHVVISNFISDPPAKKSSCKLKMNPHNDSTASKTNNISTMSTHHRVPSAGPLRVRGSSKRNQNQKAKKHQPDINTDLSSTGAVVEQRLATAVRTKKLDLSLPRHSQALPVRQSPPIQPFQIFPAIIIEHVNLLELWLTNHNLGTLPAEIAVFTKLRVLGLASNKLTALPEQLCQLVDLEALYLEKNQLQTLPTKVKFPPKLRELRLDNNQLSVFPIQITKLRLLNRLGLSYNQIKMLPEDIQRLRNLVELNLDYNRLDVDLPDGFASLQRLEWLGLEGNFLAERPTILDRLPVLSYIRLSGNRAKLFLPETNGTVEKILAVPKRHDGYFQLVEHGNKNYDTDAAEHYENHRSLEGLVPCRDQNILNMLEY